MNSLLDCISTLGKYAELNNAMRPAPHRIPDGFFSEAISLKALEAIAESVGTEYLPKEIRGATRRRRMTFLAGRLCAEMAMKKAGATDRAIPRQPDGAPAWPIGLTGSITHTCDAAYAVVTNIDTVSSLGIDSEKIVDKNYAQSIFALCCTAAEREISQRETISPLIFSTLIFSAKEALYKAIYPRLRRFLDFNEVQLESIDWTHKCLRMIPIPGSPLNTEFSEIDVGFSEADGGIHTFVSIPVKAGAVAGYPDAG